MRRHTDAAKLALTNPAVSKFKHDADNKRCALDLTTQLMERTSDPAKRDALRARAREQEHDWEVAMKAYQAALHEAVEDKEGGGI
jgi:hypothetical protein